MGVPTIFDLCVPREDVRKGNVKDEEFAADLAQVVNGNAPREYGDATVFFQHTYPTEGLKTLLETVCRRLSGSGAVLNSLIRLDTQFGGGKTHGLIALVHAVRSGRSVQSIAEFVDPSLLPKGQVRIAALTGENSDPANGLTLATGLRARSLWGEMAFRLAGEEGFRRVQKSDETHVAPGSDTLRELFGGEPTLILIDEVAVYLRKVAAVFPQAVDQFAAFIQALFKAVESTPNVALVATLAVKSDTGKGTDAYKQEQAIAAAAFEEAESVIARKVTQLNPTQDNETAAVIRRRLFESIDEAGAAAVLQAYVDTWERNRESLPLEPFRQETRDAFRHGYPFHPETLNVLMEKLSSLTTFQRTRGMLRLLARTVYALWNADPQPADALAIHPHHIDPGLESIRGELTTKLGKEEYASALVADIAAVKGGQPAIAQQIDRDHFPGMAPVTSYAARTIFLNTLAFGEAARGLAPDWLKYSIASPIVEPAFVEQARQKFIAESLYLDDRPGVPMRFMAEANLNQIVRKAEAAVDAEELRSVLNERIRSVFQDKGKPFALVPFPAGPYEVPDEIGDSRPFVCVLSYDAFQVADEPRSLPHDIVRMATRKGVNEEYRTYLNNVIFAVADSRRITAMKRKVKHRLALETIRLPERMKELSEHQQRKVNEDFAQTSFHIAQAIMQCYSHLFYPSSSGAAEAQLGHTAIELQNTSDQPGNGLVQIKRALRDQNKLLESGDKPPAPGFVKDRTPLKVSGEISTTEFRAEFRKAPTLQILLDDSPLVQCIQDGIKSGAFIYREADLVWGQGDPSPAIRISDGAFVHTMQNANEKGLWPRKPKEEEKPAGGTGSAGGGGGTGGTGGGGGGTGGAGGTGPGGDTGTGDGDGGWKPPPPPQPKTLSAQGPLAQAITELFEKARGGSVARLKEVRIVMFGDLKAINSLHQGVATFKDAAVKVTFNLGALAADGIDQLRLEFRGDVDKANGVRAFLESQIRAAKESEFQAEYGLEFESGIDTGSASAEAFRKAMTKYGGGEAYVEATALPRKEA